MLRTDRACDMHRAGIWTGSESFIFALRMQKFLLSLTSGLDFSIKSVAYKSGPGLSCQDRDSTSVSNCPSLNQRRRSRLPPPGESLRQSIDLIIVAAGKRQQLGNEPFESRSVPWAVAPNRPRTGR